MYGFVTVVFLFAICVRVCYCCFFAYYLCTGLLLSFFCLLFVYGFVAVVGRQPPVCPSCVKFSSQVHLQKITFYILSMTLVLLLMF